ncbi:MAG: IclR family transcriptional regulator [Bacillota bacterium]|nr:IclR family transcriptional regulator [Bacillota bacterium]
MTNSGKAAVSSGNTGTMRSVAQVLGVLDYLETCSSGATVTEVAEALEVHKSTASRLLASMRVAGYVTRSELTGRYSLGIRVVELAKAKLEQFDLRTHARPYLEELWRRTEETVHLAIMEGDRLVYIDKIDTTHIFVMRSRIGSRIPAYCTALGKAILAALPADDRDAIIEKTQFRAYAPKTITDAQVLKDHLKRVAHQGYAVDDEENEEGMRCVAAAIRNHSGEVVGAISISAPTSRMPEDKVQELGVLVNEVCARLSASLGYRG